MLCNLSTNNQNPFELTDFIACVQCGVTRRVDEMNFSSSDSGSETKEKEYDGYLSTSSDSRSEAGFGDDEGISSEVNSNSEDEDSSIITEITATEGSEGENVDADSNNKLTNSTAEHEFEELIEQASSTVNVKKMVQRMTTYIIQMEVT